MDSWLALVGSSIPTRGSEAATLNRPYHFLQPFRRATGQLVENHGIALIPGSERTRHSFITIDDVTVFVAACTGNPDAKNRIYEIGGHRGPQLGRGCRVLRTRSRQEVRAVHTPAAVYAVQQRLLGLVSTAAGNLMGMNRIIATQTPYMALPRLRD